MNWKEQLSDLFANRNDAGQLETPETEFIDFIEEEIIEKIIADIPDTQFIDELGIYVNDERNLYLKQQLKDKWL